jgi:hypothetical protein
MNSNKPYSRREFLKSAAIGVFAVGLLGFPRVGEGIEVTCSHCRACFRDGHPHQEGAVSGVYCPNCGIEISRLVFDVDQHARVGYSPKVSKRKKRVAQWNFAQVPFPNRKLVGTTNKPVVTFSEVNFKGRRTI